MAKDEPKKRRRGRGDSRAASRAKPARAPGSSAPPDAQSKAILDARARELARAPEGAPELEDAVQVVQFSVSHEEYAVGSAYVVEVFRLTHLTRVPCTPPFVTGIASVRGRIVSIIDLKVFFELPAKGLTDRSRLLILSSDNMEFGILIDGISAVRNISASELQPSLPTLTGIREKYLKGVTDDGVVVLDGVKLLSDTDLVVRQEVRA